MGLFLSVLLLIGGLFAVFMTLGLMLIKVLVVLMVGQPERIPALLTETPWWLIFLVSWVGFGGTMGVIEVLAKRQ